MNGRALGYFASGIGLEQLTLGDKTFRFPLRLNINIQFVRVVQNIWFLSKPCKSKPAIEKLIMKILSLILLLQITITNVRYA